VSAKYDGTVPFDRSGNMVSYHYPKYRTSPDAPWRTELRQLPPFEATLRVVDYERGQSAMRIILEDVETGVRYPMFLSDVFKYLEGVEIQGTWKPVKKGSNHGIQVVK
jgi:hypothetical protein